MKYIKEKGELLKKKGARYWLKRLVWLTGILFLGWYIFCIPSRLFSESTSTVLFDRNGKLLCAKIADDGQWRFPEMDSVPYKFEQCILEFEDRDFYKHIGISAKGIGRAIRQNMKKKKVVSGGSTITMQLARVMRKNPERSYPEKVKEMLIATRIEWTYSKKEILSLYASHAPFGGNVVGLETASWRYYGRASYQLSWAESATLAVLPNAPGLIFPGKNHEELLAKRNRLLKRMYERNILSADEYELAKMERIPSRPENLPQLTPHLMDKFIREGMKGKQIESTIDENIQKKCIQILEAHHEQLKDNQIMNGALVISSVKTGEVIAYVGNTSSENGAYSNQVDCALGNRSTGSTLKPLLYAKSLEDGLLTPDMLVSDIPSQFGYYAPKNFAGDYAGAVPASTALARSLNVPMVHLLNQYGLTKFYTDLKKYGFSTLNRPARHYGLTLILGGAEAKLLEMNQVYTQQAQVLRYGKKAPLSFLKNSGNAYKKTKENRAVIYAMLNAMIEVNRPDEDNNWRTFSSSQRIAWKTGTSFGFRDGWAIGITPDYVVAVWIGNASGEGRPGLTGIKAAAPVLFDLFRILPVSDKWFAMPAGEMASAELCAESGHRASPDCPVKSTKMIPATCLTSKVCPYHQLVHVNKKTGLRVHSDCEAVYNIQTEKWFVLPALVEKYYMARHPNYKALPPYQQGCQPSGNERPLSVIYPKERSRIFIPREIDGIKGKTIFEAAHRNPLLKVFWHLDEKYIGETTEIHQMTFNPVAGKHVLQLVDENGESVKVNFEVISD